MTLYNNGFITVQAEHGNELMEVLVKHGLVPERLKNSIITEDGGMSEISFDETFCMGDIEDILNQAIEELAQKGIQPRGCITYFGDYEGRYEIEDGMVTTLSHEECIVHDLADEEVLMEAKRRGLTNEWYSTSADTKNSLLQTSIKTVILKEVNVDGCGGDAEVKLTFPNGLSDNEVTELEEIVKEVKAESAADDWDTDVIVEEAVLRFIARYPDKRPADRDDLRVIEF